MTESLSGVSGSRTHQILSFVVAGFIATSVSLRWLPFYGILQDVWTVGLLVMLLQVWRGSRDASIPLRALVPVPLLAVLILGTFSAVSPAHAVEILALYASNALIIAAIVMASNDKRTSEAILTGIWGGALATGLLALAVEGPEMVSAGLAGAGRLGYVLSQPNAVGYLAAVGSVLTLRLINRPKSRLTKAMIPLVYIGLGGIAFATQSRRAMVAALVGAVVYVLIRSVGTGHLLKGAKAVLLLAGGGLLIGRILIPLIGDQERLQSLAGLLGDDSAANVSLSDQYRAELIHRGFELFSERPLMGWGTGSYRFLSGVGGYEEISSHNTPVDILANHGLLGAVAYYLPLVIVVWALANSAMRLNSELAAGLATLLLVELLIAGTATLTYYDKLSGLLAGVAFGEYARARRQVRQDVVAGLNPHSKSRIQGVRSARF